ncbi:ornithine cyclodeaminase family protein [Bordetella sp. N]|uniref:ornithine cyclodeaminase family protein n=1 Tax=Bordetella sp. N TaxID=1746199 RepID=UPI00070FA8D9|nr:ornithine cyclodeaminase family protein [Bordetella sp. N]ALM83599.1 hypothetical protein ASB57_12020 [Bordetella sp. N]
MRFLTEEDVGTLLPLERAIDCVEHAFRDHAAGAAVDVPRVRTKTPMGTQHILQAASTSLDVIGFKAYFPGAERRLFQAQLAQLSTGIPLAFVEADELGIRRTAAATAVATRALSREDSATVACFGTGRHGLMQLRAVCAVRAITAVRIHGRDAGRLERFAAQAGDELGLPVTIASSAEQALAGADIVNIVTRADAPLFDGRLLSEGQHINAVGSNALNRREIDLQTIRRADVLVVDAVEVARNECGDLLPAVEAGLLQWHQVVELGQVLTGCRPGRSAPEQISLFESQGMGILDLYAAHHVYRAALELQAGALLPVRGHPARG